MTRFCLLSVFFLLAACGPQKGAVKPPPPAPVLPADGDCAQPAAGPNMRVTNAIGESTDPEIVALPDGYYVAWTDFLARFPAVAAVRVDRDGVPRSVENVFPQKGACRQPSLGLDAAEIHIAWLDGPTLQSVRVDKNDAQPVTYSEKAHHLTTGPFGAVAWVAPPGQLLFRCDGMLPLPDRKGRIIEPAPVVVAKGGIEAPRMAWTGKFYALVWSESAAGGRRIVLQRVTNDGLLQGPKVAVSAMAGKSTNPVITWNGEEFAVAWTNAAPTPEDPGESYRVYMALIAKDGAKPRSTKQLDFTGSADEVSIAPMADGYGLAWVGSRRPAGSAVYFRLFDRDGNARGDVLQVTDDQPEACGRPAVAFNGDSFGVVWSDSRFYEGAEIFFSRISCAAPGNAPATDAAAEPPLKKVFE